MEIFATGMVCSVGLSAASACAAIRARIAKFDELPCLDKNGEPIVGATVPGLEDRGRLVSLLAMALADCLESGKVKQTERIPLLVGLAEPGRPGNGAEHADAIIREVATKLEKTFDPKRSAVIFQGHTSGFEALRQARELLKDPAISACFVCGVDSYTNSTSLEWLEQTDRLKTPTNPDGVIPGEAAACVIVARPGSGKREGGTTRVVGLGSALETATVLNDEPILGSGLTEAVKTALVEAGLTLHEVDFRLSDVTGEHYGFKEHALMVSRLMRGARDAFPIWHPADAIGDTGAAAGLTQLVIADRAFREGYAPGVRVLCSTSSVPGERFAAVLEFQRD